MTLQELQNKMIMYRAKHKLSQSELAKKCDVSTQTICNVETGSKGMPSKITYAKIMLVIGAE